MRTELHLERGAHHDEPGEDLLPRVAGALLAAAAADALGWITEFVRGPDHLRKLHGTDRVTSYRGWQKTSGGRFNAYIDRIHSGEYSDDTQLMLALARSLRPDGSVDLAHFAKEELPLWLDYARGAGSTITAAARALTRKSAQWNSNFFTYRQRGGESSYRNAGANGAAMRVAPVALANPNDVDLMARCVFQASIVTHGHPRAILGAVLYAEALRWVLAKPSTASTDDLLADLSQFIQRMQVPDGDGVAKWIDQWNADAARPFGAVWDDTKREIADGLELIHQATSPQEIPLYLKRLGCFDSATKGSGTGTVLAGLVVFRVLGDDLRQAVITTINQLGTDTDTIGGFVGGLCGARHSYQAIPEEWASQLQDYEYFMRVAEEVSRIARREGRGGKALLPDGKGEALEYPKLLDLLREKSLDPHQRVYHPLFGLGWVEAVDAQRLRRKDGAEIVFARVLFDIGQSCKFRYMKIPGRGRPSRKAPPKGPRQPSLDDK